MYSSINARLHKLENTAKERANRTDTGACTCPFGKQHIYFTFDTLTEAEAAEKYPDNKKYCPVCGGLNIAVNLFDEIDIQEK